MPCPHHPPERRGPSRAISAVAPHQVGSVAAGVSRRPRRDCNCEADKPTATSRTADCISERKRAQDQIRQSQERFELALKGADLATWDWNIKTGEVIFNARWAEMRGFRPEEIMPHVDSWVTSVHPDDWPQVQKALTDYLEGRIPEYQIEHRVLTKCGEWIWVLDRGKVFARDDQAQPSRMVGTELDITERKRAEEALRRAIQTRDEVLGIVAHHLRNPLNSIVMQAALLRRRGAPAERGPAEAIERAATRMNRFIQDLLDVARMEAGWLSVERVDVSTDHVLTDSMEAQKPLAASASVELALDKARELPEVWADRDRLLQVFENLIGNAIKFTQPGGLIVVGAAPQEDEVLFWVTDTGTGIASEDQPHLFDRFWQARKAERRGAGLGLPIVKGIVESHGGRIWVESAPRRGSTFFFTIPAVARSAMPFGEC